MMSATSITEALEQGKAVPARFGDLSYLRLIDDCGPLLRGSAVFASGTVYGYPRIGRLLALEPGLSGQFHDAPFAIEEKIDGYNVRIVQVGGRVLALTRGGFVCPFTTDRVADLMPVEVFEHERDLVVCAEVAGPENPYQEGAPPFISEDVRLFVFDLMRWDCPGFLSTEEKLGLLERHRLPAVSYFGRYTAQDVEAIRSLARRLDAEGREGMVFKEDPPRNHRVKYVTCRSSIADIRGTAHNLLELQPEYFTSRILRLVLFLQEQGLERSPDLDRELGAAFLDGLLEAIRQFRAEHKVHRTFCCRFRRRDNAVRLLDHLAHVSGHVQISLRDLRQEGDYWRLSFDRTYPRLNGLLNHLFSGGLVVD